MIIGAKETTMTESTHRRVHRDLTERREVAALAKDAQTPFRAIQPMMHTPA
jgi:hypothetical protein